MRGSFWVWAGPTLGAVLLMAALSGCAVVQVHVADPADVKTQVYPFGVRIEAQSGAAEGVYVETGNIGLLSTAGGFAIGINDSTIYQIDADACALGIVTHASAETLEAARDAAAFCRPQKRGPP